MMEIIQTPNVEANKMLFDEEDVEVKGEEGNDLEEEDEGEEDDEEDEDESD